MEEIQEIKDKLDSLHSRVDKFYAWAAILQKEFRDMQQRQGFIESQFIEIDGRLETSESDPLKVRMAAIKEMSI